MNEVKTTPGGGTSPGGLIVACCGCSGIAMRDGSLFRVKGLFEPGPNGAWGKFEASKAMTFTSREQADNELGKLGWRVEGGNHRCPDCRWRDDSGKRHGAYFDLATMRQAVQSPAPPVPPNPGAQGVE